MEEFTIHYVFDMFAEGSRTWEHQIEEVLTAADMAEAETVVTERLGKDAFLVDDSYGERVAIKSANVRCCRITPRNKRAGLDVKSF